MKLTPRLAAIAELIPQGSIVADIGTDHAYLPAYLVMEQISQRVVATDLHDGPLEQARETVAAFNCLQKIDLRRGNGLEALQPEDGVNTVVIAGLGGNSIVEILRQGRHKLNGVSRLILQPMNDAGSLRVYLAQNGYALEYESLVLEGKRLYEIILAAQGKESETDPFRLFLGPRLLEHQPPLLKLLLEEKLRKLKIVYDSLQKARHRDVSTKLGQVRREMIRLEEVLAGAGKRPDSD